MTEELLAVCYHAYRYRTRKMLAIWKADFLKQEDRAYDGNERKCALRDEKALFSLRACRCGSQKVGTSGTNP
jgi:hypothetical protein